MKKSRKINHWEEIYKSGKVWGSLLEEIHPLFKKFVKQTNSKIKYVLDIGCGTGSYLKFLKDEGFKISGVDSSKTAIANAKRLLGENSNVKRANMFNFNIPRNKYDLIISVSSIHHGTKKQIKNLINKIYNSLSLNGKIFITIPDVKSSQEWNTFKNSKEIRMGEFKPFKGPERGLIHSFYSKKEIEGLFSKFKNLRLDIDKTGRWIVTGKK